MTTGLCEVHFNSLGDLVGFFSWITVTGVIYMCFGWFTWNPKKYAVFRDQAMFLPQRLLFCYLTVLLCLYGWSAWRVWYCDNWNVEPTPLIIYVVKVIFVSWISPTFMLTNSVWLSVIVSLCALAFAITNCVLFFIEDSWAGLVGVVDIITISLITLILIYLGKFRQDVFDLWINIHKTGDKYFITGIPSSEEGEEEASSEANPPEVIKSSRFSSHPSRRKPFKAISSSSSGSQKPSIILPLPHHQ